MDTVQKKRPLAAVIFDMDGLMFDTERIVKRSWDEAAPLLGLEPLGHHIYHTLGMNLARRRQYFKEACGPDFPFEEFTECYRGISREILRREGLPVKPGLYQLLDCLKEKKIPMAVATSSSARHAGENLREAGVEQYFSCMITGDQVKRSKPDPEIYLLACRKLGVPPEEAMALEDSANGLRAALDAGVMAVMVPDLLTDLPELEPYLTAKLPSLTAVRDYIKKMWP